MFGFFPQGHHPFAQGHPFGQEFEEEYEQEEVENTELYEILGVPPQSDTGTVKKAYLKLAKEKHPDRGGDKLEFQKIQKSYDVLKDPKLKEIYDKHGINGLKKQGGRRNQDQQSKCQQIVIPLELTLEEVFLGLTRYEKVKINKICNDCQGSGGKNSSVCSFCRGQRIVQLNQEIAPGMYISQPGPCPTCRGTGMIIKEEDACKVCLGKGTNSTESDVEIVVEKGVAEGHIIKLYGKGNEKAGSLQGDIFVEVAIKKHDQFNRKGSDLFLTKSITLKDALLGVNFTIKHLDGELITIKTDQIISPNRILSVPGLGMPTYRDEMNRGDLNIQFNIVFPTELTDQDRVLIKKLSQQGEQNNQEGKVFSLEPFSMGRHEKNSKVPEDDEDQDGMEQQCRMF